MIREFYRSVWLVIDALNKKLPVDFGITYEQMVKANEVGFAQKSRQFASRGAVGAIDGCLIRPKISESAARNLN